MPGARRGQPAPVDDGRHASVFGWGQVDFVLGARENMLPPGHTRTCPGCGEDVFTSLAYPADVVVLCSSCALAELEPNAEEDARLDDP